MLKMFKCEKCQMEFNNPNECIEHEAKCYNFEENINHSLDIALEKLNNKYELKVIKRNVQCGIMETDITYPEHIFQIWLDCILPNGNSFSTNHQSFWNCDVTKSEEIFKRLEEYILPLLDTTYEGVASCYIEDGWYEYKIGEIDVHEVFRRLDGRKIKIEVIE